MVSQPAISPGMGNQCRKLGLAFPATRESLNDKAHPLSNHGSGQSGASPQGMYFSNTLQLPLLELGGSQPPLRFLGF